MNAFDSIIVLDWSASSVPKRGKDSIWIGQAGAGAAAPVNPPTRTHAMAVLRERIGAAKGRRLLIGADFPFGYPTGFARALTGRDGALAVWDWLAAHVLDGSDNANNRFALAQRINAGLPGIGPFWGRPAHLDLQDLPATGTARRDMPFAERRRVEALEPRAQPVWKLYTTGSVGSQALLGIARLAHLRAELGRACAVWPLEPWEGAGVVLAEVWPSLLAREVAAQEAAYPCRDAAQVDLLARALAGVELEALASLMRPDQPPETLAEEGWILGAGQAGVLRAGLTAGPRRIV